MPRPNAKMKISRDGNFRFESNVDAVIWTIRELIMAANRDVGRYIRKKVGLALVSRFEREYVKNSVVEPRRKKLIRKHPLGAMQYWARKRDLDLLIGFKVNSWYGKVQELGDYGTPKMNILRNTVMNEIAQIREIQAQYLTALNEMNPSVEEINDARSEDDY